MDLVFPNFLYLLKPFYATDLFLHPLKALENLGFFMFSGSIKGDQWLEVGYTNQSFRVFSIFSFENMKNFRSCTPEMWILSNIYDEVFFAKVIPVMAKKLLTNFAKNSVKDG